MQPKPHGQYTIEWQGDILHVHPRGNFNEYGIINLKEAILDKVKDHGKWVLFERPVEKAGIIPEAIHELANAYNEYQQQGCILVIMDVPGVFGAAIKAEVNKLSNIPLHFSTDSEHLAQIAQDALNHSA